MAEPGPTFNGLSIVIERSIRDQASDVEEGLLSILHVLVQRMGGELRIPDNDLQELDSTMVLSGWYDVEKAEMVLQRKPSTKRMTP